MYFYEVFGKCDLEVVVHEFLKLAVDSPDINVTEEVFRGAIKILNEMEPEKSDTEILCIEKIQESGWIDDNVYLLDSNIKTQTRAVACSNSLRRASSGSAGSNTGTYSQKKYDHVKENTMSTMNNQKDNRPAYETDTNPNHHYIADYRSFGGIKLFKVHDSMGDYIMLDNSITSRKICNLKEAESGKHKFYRRENGKEINIAEIPWK